MIRSVGTAPIAKILAVVFPALAAAPFAAQPPAGASPADPLSQGPIGDAEAG